MGKRKRGTVARAENAKNVMKSYWEKKRAPAAEVATAPKETPAAHRLRLLADKLSGEEEVSDDNSLVVISVGRLKELLLRNCDSCGEQTQTEIKRKYFDCEVKVRCTTCDLVLCDSKPRKAKIGNFTEANSVLVFHSISNGYGRAGLSRLSALFGTTDMQQTAFMNCARAFYRAMDNFYKEQQNIVLETVREVHTKQDATVVQSTDRKIDVGVGYDGTWMTRGHKSHIQAGFVIEMATGFVLDFDIISNYCKSCSVNKKKKSKENFEAWQETVHAGKCEANFDGLSGRMEAECAIRLWGRSEDIGFRYTTFLSDGDSSAFTSVTKMNDGEGPYSVKVVKEECVNHVKKRMGTRLRKLKDELKEDVVTKTGKVIKRSVLSGKHQLTDKQIDAFQNYYGKAIKDSVGTDVTTMKLKAMSGFWHAISRDGEGNHHHVYCDPSWCIFKHAVVNNEPMPSHNIMRNYLRLEKKYEDRVRQVFFDLTTPALLERCLKGHTQNRNESLHSKLWIHVNKAKFAGQRRVRFMAQLTVLEHNIGYEHTRFIAAVGFPSTTQAAITRHKMDEAKISPRQPTKRRKTGKGPLSADYQPGGFDS